VCVADALLKVQENILPRDIFVRLLFDHRASLPQ
jgi:hypothetical protein